MNEVPYIVHESTMARMERIQRRQWIVILVLVALLMGSNIAWLIYTAQFEVVETTEIEQDGEGVNIVGGGDVNYGAEGNSN